MTDAIQIVGIVGAGTMGSGIMINSVMHGFEVVLCDRSPEVLEVARNQLDTYLVRQINKERLTTTEAACAAKRLTTTERNSALEGCDLVIEAVFENLDLKQRIFTELEAIVAPGTILASNTSCLRLADIAAELVHKDRFCGMHYFSPAEINPVVELIEGPGTSPEALSAVASFLKATGKEAIACKDQNGFALNRFFCPYTNEAVRLLDEGIATTGQIDAVAKATFGLALGPFAVMNIVGTATNLNAVRNLEPLGPFYTAAKGLIAKGTENASWEIEKEPQGLDTAISKIIADRLTGAILLPVLEELEEHVARLEDIDKGAAMAFRFQKTPGKLLDELGKENVQGLIGQLANRQQRAQTIHASAEI
jgi:3-hydroxybutyryl-CoA dehydrogenase